MGQDYLGELGDIVKLSPTQPYEAVADRYIALIARHPQRVEAYQSLALYACLCGQFAAAEYVIGEALQLPAGQARSHYIRARIADEALAPASAVAHYEQALQLEPGNDRWRFNLGLAQLTLGDFANGSANYRHRLSPQELAVADRLPAWTPDRAAERVLIWAEQGLGDELMFARLLPCLQAHHARGCRFTLQCDPRLLPLFRRSHRWLDFVPRGLLAPLLPGFDAQLPIGDLLALFHGRLREPAVLAAVLQPPPRPGIAALAAPSQAAGRQRVGISWLSMNTEYGMQRSLPLPQLLQAFTPALHTLVNLQYLAPPEHLQALRDHGFDVVDGVDAYNDIEGLAALAAQCDTIVTIDNSLLHLAGALGLKTWALIPRLPNWRWQLDSPRTDWYASVELLRQAVPCDWSAEVAELRQRLAGAGPAGGAQDPSIAST